MCVNAASDAAISGILIRKITKEELLQSVNALTGSEEYVLIRGAFADTDK